MLSMKKKYAMYQPIFTEFDLFGRREVCREKDCIFTNRGYSTVLRFLNLKYRR